MDLKQALRELESKGKMTARKSYVRHGVTGSCFGVTSGDLLGMARIIKVDYDLALGLWGSGNHDARVLATLIVDTDKLDQGTALSWLADADNNVLIDAIANVMARMPSGLGVCRRLMDSDLEWPSTAAWSALAKMVVAGVIDNSFAAQLLSRIERTIRSAPNRTRHAMNDLVIAVGGHRDGLRDQALITAQAIGVVDVNHGESGGKTPDAALAIAKVAAGEKSKAAKALKAAHPKLKGR